MTLAGTWRAMDGTMMIVQGNDPLYTFQFFFQGMPLSQGQVQLQMTGSYVASGMGVQGPVSIEIRLLDHDILEARNNLLVDGGLMDQMLRNMGVGAALQQLQPALRMQRDRPMYVPQIDAAPPPPKREPTQPTSNDPVGTSAFSSKTHERRKAVAAEDESTEDPMLELGRLIGMQSVKAQLEQLEAWAWRQQQLGGHNVKTKGPSLHMSFTGNPGTGKTTIARIIGRLLKKYDLLENGRLHESRRADLVAEYVGQTSPKTEKLIEESLGGVLFIDEAYSISEPGVGGGARDFGAEALAALIAGMENHRHELCVIVAGYTDEMERFIDANAGLASRISRHVPFPDFTEEELCEVFEALASEQNLEVDGRVLTMLGPYLKREKAKGKPRQWGNARAVRNVLERGIENQSVRLKRGARKPSKAQLLQLTAEDFAFLGQP